MAYFGGSTTARPWPRFNPMTIMLSMLILLLVAGLFYVTAGRYAQALKPAAAKEAAVQPPARVPVLVAVEDIQPGRLLTPALFITEARNIEGMESLVLREFAQVNQKYSVAPIRSGTPLFSNQIADYPPAVAFTSRIPAGMRAVSIRVNAESAVEGWARPGARADVVWSTEYRGKNVVTTIVENVEVLSAGSTVKQEGDKSLMQDSRVEVPTHVTLLVSIADAQRIQIAKTSGALYLNLRGDSDTQPTNSGTITVGNLLKSSGLVPFDDIEARIKVDGREYVLSGGEIEPVEDGKNSYFKKFFESFPDDGSARAGLRR